MEKLTKHIRRLAIVVVVYVVSSGPVIGLGCWLREATGNNNFYAVFVPYIPLFYFEGSRETLRPYFNFWVGDVFDTVGPG